MAKKLYINEEAFCKAQKKAIKILQYHIVLFFLFLIIYFVVGVTVQNTLYPQENQRISFVIQSGIEVGAWMIVSVLLWKQYPIGRLAYCFVGLLSLYSVYTMMDILSFDVVHGVDSIIRLCFIILFLCKCLTTIQFAIHMYREPMRCIWEVYAKEGKTAVEEDEELIRRIMNANNKDHKLAQSRKKIVKQALCNLRRSSILLFVILYGSMIGIYMFMFIFRYLFISDVQGIDYVQRYCLLATLFTALVWSLSAVLLFLNKSVAKLCIMGACVAEIIRFALTIQDTIQAFQSQSYGIPSLLILIVLEGIRYMILIRFSMKIINDPFTQAYWKYSQK